MMMERSLALATVMRVAHRLGTFALAIQPPIKPFAAVTWFDPVGDSDLPGNDPHQPPPRRTEEKQQEQKRERRGRGGVTEDTEEQLLFFLGALCASSVLSVFLLLLLRMIQKPPWS